jgi:hypothetical protein
LFCSSNIEQQEARAKIEGAKKEAVQAAADAKKKSDEDKLAKIQKLILAQRDEQIRREETEKKGRVTKISSLNPRSLLLHKGTKGSSEKQQQRQFAP